MNLNLLYNFIWPLDSLQKSPHKRIPLGAAMPCLYINVAVRSLLIDPFVSDSIMLYFFGLTGRKSYRHIVTQRVRGFPVLKYEPKDLTLSFRTKSLNVWSLLLINETSYYSSALTWKKDGHHGHHLGVPTSTALYEKDPFAPFYSGFHLNWVSSQELPWIKLHAQKKTHI